MLSQGICAGRQDTNADVWDRKRDTMKKVLLSTSAIAIVGAYAGAAGAAEWNVRVSGYMEQFIAYASSDVDNISGEEFDGVDSKQDAEIRFLPSITLDNGIKIGADVQLEANTTGDTIDESFMFIDGSFGRVQLGSENSAGYTMTIAAPDVTFLNVNSGSTTAFVPFSGTTGNATSGSVQVGDNIFRGTLGTTFLENLANNDAQRFTYFTPRLAGVQVGFSYARDPLQDDNSQVDTNGEIDNFFDVGANYVNSFGGIDVAVSGRWGIAFDPNGSDPQVYSFGANLGFSGVTVGGSFAEQNNSGNLDGQSFDVGISYETGPWGVSFTYFNGENVDNENPTNPFGNDEELDQYLVGVNYKLAKGVDLSAFGAYIDFEEDNGDAAGNVGVASGDDVDGFIIGTGIKISF
ncbi:MAG: porin [Pseudomonadota bacterium]